MRSATLLLLMIFGLAAASSAQSTDLTLNWDPMQTTVSASVELTGTANIPDQQIFFVEAAPFAAANAKVQWIPVVLPQSAPVVDGAIGSWDTTRFSDGFYQLRLRAVNSQ